MAELCRAVLVALDSPILVMPMSQNQNQSTLNLAGGKSIADLRQLMVIIEMGGFDEGRTMGRLMGKNTEREDAQAIMPVDGLWGDAHSRPPSPFEEPYVHDTPTSTPLLNQNGAFPAGPRPQRVVWHVPSGAAVDRQQRRGFT
ncbi:hypothetical protein V8C43DRAFT_320309 [Trichoderma afarasin]